MQYKSHLFIPVVNDWCAHVIAFTAMRPSTIYLRIPFLLLELNMRLYILTMIVQCSNPIVFFCEMFDQYSMLMRHFLVKIKISLSIYI